MIGFEAPTKTSCWPLVRVKEYRSVGVILSAPGFLRVATHWARKTVICVETDDCPLCACLPSRAYWYVPAVYLTTGQPCLLELSALSSGDLEQRAKFFGRPDLLGVQVELSRKGKRSPVRSEVVGHDPAARTCPAHIWVSKLMHVFGLRPLAEGESIETYSEAVRPQALQRARLAGANLRLPTSD